MNAGASYLHLDKISLYISDQSNILKYRGQTAENMEIYVSLYLKQSPSWNADLAFANPYTTFRRQ